MGGQTLLRKQVRLSEHFSRQRKPTATSGLEEPIQEVGREHSKEEQGVEGEQKPQVSRREGNFGAKQKTTELGKMKSQQTSEQGAAPKFQSRDISPFFPGVYKAHLIS